MRKILPLLLVVLGGILNVSALEHQCFNPSSNSIIPYEGEYTTIVNIQQDSTSIEVSYILGTISMEEDDLFPDTYRLILNGFGESHTNGTPWLPVKADIYCLDEGSGFFHIDILSAQYVDYNVEVAPSRKLSFENDTIFVTKEDVTPVGNCVFKSDTEVAKIHRVNQRGNQSVVSVLISPIQYDSSEKKIRVYKEFTYRLSYRRIVDNETDNGQRRPNLSNVLNLYYLILGKNESKGAVQDFCEWKKKTGYKVIEKYDDYWTFDKVKYAIDSVYYENGGLDYVLLLGDNNSIPGQYTTDFNPNYSDYSYSCINNDDMPDLYIGRIPGKSVADIKSALDKIVRYEMNPPTKASFYNTWLLNAYFQIDGKDIERTTRRFVETCEDVRNYVTPLGINCTRNYYAYPYANPKLWSKDYGTGGEIPQELQKPNFAWDGNSTIINNSINSGCNIILTRSHGSTTSWSRPFYSVSDLSALKTVSNPTFPIIFSLACSTGSFSSSIESLCQALLKKKMSGAVGIIGATQPSFTKLNDVYAHGIVNLL